MPPTSSSAFEEALRHLEQNDVAAARNALEAILAESPDSVEARLALGVLLSRGTERALARKHFAAVLELLEEESGSLAESLRARALLNLCALALEEGDWKETRLRESTFDVYRDVFQREGSLEQATQLLLNAGVHAARGDAYEEARILTERAVSLDPTFAEGWWNLSALAYREGAFTDAKTYARRALELDENLAEASFLLGNLTFDESPEEGLALLERAVALKPQEIEWVLALATAYARRGNYLRARTFYAAVLRLDASRADAHLGFAVASRALGDMESARHALSRAFALNPEFAAIVRRMMAREEEP